MMKNLNEKSNDLLLQNLKSLHDPDGLERVGFILPDGSLVEVQNISPTPDIAFVVPGEDILAYAIGGLAAATWHTHPKKDANLTVEDNTMFLNYPDLQHYIVGTDGVRCYEVVDGKVMNA